MRKRPNCLNADKGERIIFSSPRRTPGFRKEKQMEMVGRRVKRTFYVHVRYTFQRSTIRTRGILSRNKFEGGSEPGYERNSKATFKVFALSIDLDYSSERKRVQMRPLSDNSYFPLQFIPDIFERNSQSCTTKYGRVRDTFSTIRFDRAQRRVPTFEQDRIAPVGWKRNPSLFSTLPMVLVSTESRTRVHRLK